MVPDYALPDINGGLISLSDFKNYVVLVNVWATWCPPCVYEMPSMEKLHQQFISEKFKTLAVSIDSLGTKAVAPFMENCNLAFEALIDPQRRNYPNRIWSIRFSAKLHHRQAR